MSLTSFLAVAISDVFVILSNVLLVASALKLNSNVVPYTVVHSSCSKLIQDLTTFLWRG